MLPFSRTEFYEVFERYNQTVWPAQFWLYLLAIAAFLLGRQRRSIPGYRAALAIVGVLWIWMGIVYHAHFFSRINSVAWVFASGFLLQGIVLASYAVRGPAIPQRDSSNRTTGIGLVAVGLLVYPIISIAFGDVYPSQPTFGLPCPTTIFTIGIMLMVPYRVPRFLFVIPAIWSMIGFVAAMQLSVKQDTALLLALTAAIFGRRFPQRPEEAVVSTG